MNRRNFLRLSAGSYWWLQACGNAPKEESPIHFDITLHADAQKGHLVHQAAQFAEGNKMEAEVLIVGGGMAGLSAAASLPHQDFLLCELSDELGGSSGCHRHQQTLFSQGAHYELTYPTYFGEEALAFLESLKVIQFNNMVQKWEYIDHQYLIPPKRESQCLDEGTFRMDVLPDEGYDTFFEFIEPLTGKLKLPTRTIDPALHFLNGEAFQTYLRRKIALPEGFYRGLDYHMMDDFGGTSNEVSALAGIYYYANRPYETSEHEIFSPPEGNFYFAQKMIDKLPNKQLLKGYLVKQIKPSGKGFEAEVIDTRKMIKHSIKANKVVYAGQKHALKFVCPEVAEPFKTNVYAPWVVVNLLVQKDALPQGVWQNEFLGADRSFMGFVDSDAQYSSGNYRVLTAYYCFPAWQRENVLALTKDDKAQHLVQQTVRQVAQFFELSYQELGSLIEVVYLKPMGHAMPVPVPNYLFNDKNINRPFANFTFAGVDNSRLPLLFEAIDSGIQAVSHLYGRL